MLRLRRLRVDFQRSLHSYTWIKIHILLLHVRNLLRLTIGGEFLGPRIDDLHAGAAVVGDTVDAVGEAGAGHRLGHRDRCSPARGSDRRSRRRIAPKDIRIAQLWRNMKIEDQYYDEREPELLPAAVGPPMPIPAAQSAAMEDDEPSDYSGIQFEDFEFTSGSDEPIKTNWMS